MHMASVLLTPFMVLAGIGFVLSLMAHVASLVGIQLPGGQAVFGLHAGIFAVWIPTMITMMRVGLQGASRRDMWKVALRGCPTWMQRAAVALFIYALVNLGLSIATTANGPQPSGESPPAVIRAFSGHWLLFYGMAFAVLYSATRRPDLLRPKRCSKEHSVSITDVFCPQCGERLGGKTRHLTRASS